MVGQTNCFFTRSWDYSLDQSKFCKTCDHLGNPGADNFLTLLVVQHVISFRSYVADYTDFRCKKFESCWFPWAGAGKETKTKPTHACSAGGIFHHGKARRVFGPFAGEFPNVTAQPQTTPYLNKYHHDCSII